MKKLAALAIAASFSAAVFAAPETYVIDGNHTMPRFEYSHMGFSEQLSRFDKASGSVTIDRAVFDVACVPRFDRGKQLDVGGEHGGGRVGRRLHHGGRDLVCAPGQPPGRVHGERER